MTVLFTVDGDLVDGAIVDRPNRFVVRVRFDEDAEKVLLGDPGALQNIISPGREILCSPVNSARRVTDFDAIAVNVDGTFVSVRAALANDLFRHAMKQDALSTFAGYTILKREPDLPAHGHTDFLLETAGCDEAYVEIKSSTHVEDGVAKFPDRPTKRGRRHLQSLMELQTLGKETHVCFVVQRPDVRRMQPYWDIDREFGELLSKAQEAGVNITAVTISFDPPQYVLRDSSLPVDLTIPA